MSSPARTGTLARMPFALVALCAFFAMLFGPTLLAGRFVIIGDPLKEFYPLRMVAWQMIRDGHLPSWTPHIFSGYPLSSMVMLGLGYPLTWGYLVFPGPWAEQCYVLAPYLLASLFTALFLREWDCTPVASVIGALTFAYGGFMLSPIGLTGVHANSALWMPLLLFGVARARRRPFVESFLIATAAYTMSILAGSGQMFLYAGALAVAYAVFLAASARPRWRPVAVIVCAIGAAVGLTAFQTLQTWKAVHQSVRVGYSEARMAEGSFAPGLAWHSLLQPLGNFEDSATFVPLAALVLAAVALIGAGRRHRHIYFWAFIAAIAWLLILGRYTPLFDVYVRVPFVTMFRYPSRHTMEWTFAIGVLAAYGWDFLQMRLTKRIDGGARRDVVLIACAVLLAVAAGFVAERWIRSTMSNGLDQVGDINNSIKGLDLPYLAWKAAFTLLLFLVLVVLLRLQRNSLRGTLLVSAVALGFFVEPYLWMERPVVARHSTPRRMFGSLAEVTQVLKRRLNGERTFSLPHPYAVPADAPRDVDAVNWTALGGLQDANGYESLILSRYKAALEGKVDTEPVIGPDVSLLGPDSHVLDVLNVRYVVAYTPFSAGPRYTGEFYGVSFTTHDMAVDLDDNRPFRLFASGKEIDAMAAVTSLSDAAGLPQGTPVARLRIHTTGGRVIERNLIAGLHTAEQVYDARRVRHAIVPIYDDFPPGAPPAKQIHRYFAVGSTGEPMRITEIDFQKIAPNAGMTLWKFSVHEAGGKWVPLPQPPADRWRTIDDRNGVVILENLRVLPRAWLVPKVEALDAIDILHRVRGEDAPPFDPRAEAFVEVSAGPAARAAANELGATAPAVRSPGDVRIVDPNPTRMKFETTTANRAMLVISEVFYPGFVATLDGTRVPIHHTNFLLRGIVVPPGRHTIEMIFHPPGARNGAVVSLGTLVLLAVAVRLGGRRDSR